MLMTLKLFAPVIIMNLNDLIKSIRLELNSLALWCAKSCLKLNVEKCGWIYTGNSNLELTFEVNGQRLTKLNSVVDLFSRYSSNLTLSEQTDYNSCKTRGLLGCTTRNFFCWETKVLMYKVCIRSILKYCSFILSGLRLKDKLKLEGVQRQFTLRALGSECCLEYTEQCSRLKTEQLWGKRLEPNLIFYYN